MVSSLIIALVILYCIFYRSLPGGYIIRVVITLIKSCFQPKLTKLSDGTISYSNLSFRVWFCDIDNYGHMNNGSYNLYCDYGRYNLAARLFGINWLGKEYCVVGASNMQYIRSLKLFQKVNLRTSIVCASGKNVWFRQSFECDGKVYAVALMKMVFLNYQFKSLNGKEALENVIPEAVNDEKWVNDRYSAAHYEKIGDEYVTLNDDIKLALDQEYKDKDIPVIIHSNRVKSEYYHC